MKATGWNQQVYQRLKLAFELGLKRQIFVAVCDDWTQTDALAARLQSDLSPQGVLTAGRMPGLVSLNLQSQHPDPMLQIRHWRSQHLREQEWRSRPSPGFQILGVEPLIRQSASVQWSFLRALRQLPQCLPELDSSLLFWMSRPWRYMIARSTPEFWRCCTGIFEFIGEPIPQTITAQAITALPSALPAATTYKAVQTSEPIEVWLNVPESGHERQASEQTIEFESPFLNFPDSDMSGVHDRDRPTNHLSSLDDTLDRPPETTIKPFETFFDTFVDTLGESETVTTPLLTPGQEQQQQERREKSDCADSTGQKDPKDPKDQGSETLDRHFAANIPPDTARDSASDLASGVPSEVALNFALSLDVELVEQVRETRSRLISQAIDPLQVVQQLVNLHRTQPTHLPTHLKVVQALAATYQQLGTIYRDSLDGDQPDRQCMTIALRAYESALECWLLSMSALRGSASTHRTNQTHQPHPTQKLAHGGGLPPTLKSAGDEHIPMLANDIGTLYWMLSDSSTTIATRQQELQQGIAAFQIAIAHLDEVEQPFAWASIQDNIGSICTDLARTYAPDSEASRQTWQAAIAAFKASLRCQHAELDPQQFAATHNNLGTAFWNLAQIDQPVACLKQAITAYETALAFYKSDHDPLSYAMLLTNLGTAFWNLARYDQPLTHLQSAIRCYRMALEHRTPETHPAGCAAIYNNLGTAYWNLAEVLNYPSDREAYLTTLYEAVTAYQTAVELAARLRAEWEQAQPGALAPSTGTEAAAGTATGTGQTVDLATGLGAAGSGDRDDSDVSRTEHSSEHLSERQPRPPLTLGFDVAAAHHNLGMAQARLGGCLTRSADNAARQAHYERAIAAYLQAIEGYPAEHPRQSVLVDELAIVLRALHDTGGLSAQNRAFSLIPAPLLLQIMPRL